MTCCNTTRGLAIRWSLASPNVPVLISVTGTGTTRVITITTNNPGFYELHAWLTDTATDPNVLATPPADSADNEWRFCTNSAGVATITLRHSGSVKSFYLWVNLSGGLSVVSDEIAFI